MAATRELPPLRGKHLGARVVEAYANNRLTRAEFIRRLQATSLEMRKLAATTVFSWEQEDEGHKQPKYVALKAISVVTGYSIDELMQAPAADDAATGDQAPLSAEELDQAATRALPESKPWLTR